MYMGEAEWIASINALAVSLARCLTEEELEVAAAACTLLGDTLGTIAVYRAVCGKKKEGTV